MFQPVRIAPSILSADFMHLADEIAEIEKGGAGFIHVDVMDGHFVPNLTIGVPHVKQLKRVAQIPLDVHLMISNPLEQLPWFLEAGPDMVTVHIEALDDNDVERAIEFIHAHGAKASLSVKPNTPVGAIAPYIALLDMVLVMSVEPGFSGQSYIAGSENKVAEVAAIAQRENPALLIEVDGGIGISTVERVCAQGADVVVCGNAVFGEADRGKAIQAIKSLGDEARLQAMKG